MRSHPQRQTFMLTWSKKQTKGTQMCWQISSWKRQQLDKSWIIEHLSKLKTFKKYEKPPNSYELGGFCGCGGRIWTNDLRVMSSIFSVFYHFLSLQKFRKTHKTRKTSNFSYHITFIVSDRFSSLLDKSWIKNGENRVGFLRLNREVIPPD